MPVTGCGQGCGRGCQPRRAAQDTAGMWGAALGSCIWPLLQENLSSALLPFSCTPALSRHRFMGKMHGLISSWYYQSWYCSSASNDIEKFTACAASGCVSCGPGLLGPQPCGSGSGWVAVPSSTLYAFCLVCGNKCWVMAGGCLAQGDTVFGETLSRLGRSTFCMSN